MAEVSPLADSHCHLDGYPDEALPGLLSRAGAAGVGLILGAGVDLASSRRSVEIARRFSMVYAGIGLHPAFLRQPVDEEQLTGFRELSRSSPRVVAISEIGLDREAPQPALQQQAFREMLRLGLELELPVVLHSVGGHGEVLAALKREGATRWGAVMHYFQGDAALARQCIELGIHLSLGKPLTRDPRLQQVIREVPLEWLLLETDSYPQPGRATEPADVKLIAETLATIKGVDPTLVAEQTTANLRQLLFKG